MTTFPGIVALVIFLYLRPHEFFEALRDWNLLYYLLGACVAAMLHDVARRRVRLVPTPQLGWVLLFVSWCLTTVAVRRPDEIWSRGSNVVVCALVYVILAHCVQHVRALLKVILVIYAIALFVAYVGVDQGLRPFECVVINPSVSQDSITDGRPCPADDDADPYTRNLSCIVTGRPGVMYRCERVGLLGTTSIAGGRVRYLGTLQDPNDLALATAMAVPTAFALFQMRRSILRFALLVATVALVGVEVVFTGSRGGQLTFVAVLGAFFVRAFGLKRGIVVAVVLGAPMVLLGGRSGGEGSTLERLGCNCAGIKMLLYQPIFGVGHNLFTESHGLTAHNAYILAAGELGLPGMSIFAFVLYLSVKVPLAVLRSEVGTDADSRAVKALAMALLAAIGGGAVGIYFLSWTYHFVLWIHFGLSGALYSVAKVRDPRFECRFSVREGCGIVLGYVAILTLWAGYIKHMGAWE